MCDAIAPEFPDIKFKLKVYGSAANSFWTDTSDVDLAFVTESQFETAPVIFLEKMKRGINKSGIGHVDLIPAMRIPILKYEDKLTHLKCDINANSILGISNSALVYSYAKYDERFRILGFFIKDWAKENHIQGGDHGYLTSYAYLVMLIQYLQNTHPPVLPNLQNLALDAISEKERENGNIRFLVPEFIVNESHQIENAETEDKGGEYGRKMEILRKMKMVLIPTNVFFEKRLGKVHEYMKEKCGGLNKQSIPELLAGFFRYYGYEFEVNFLKIFW